MTNEQMDFSRYKTFWRRFFAIMLDGVALMIISWPAVLFTASVPNPSPHLISWLRIPIDIFTILYLIYFVYRFGQTPGKMAMGVKVLSDDGNSLRLKQAVLREIVPIIFLTIDILVMILILSGNKPNPKLIFYKEMGLNFAAFIWAILELITMLTNRKRRAIHDFIAGTIVIKQLPEERVPAHKKIFWSLIILFFLHVAGMYKLMKKFPSNGLAENQYMSMTSTENGVRSTTIFENPIENPKEDEVDVKTLVSKTEEISPDGTKLKVRTSVIRRYKKGQEPQDPDRIIMRPIMRH